MLLEKIRYTFKVFILIAYLIVDKEYKSASSANLVSVLIDKIAFITF